MILNMPQKTNSQPKAKMVMKTQLKIFLCLIFLLANPTFAANIFECESGALGTLTKQTESCEQYMAKGIGLTSYPKCMQSAWGIYGANVCLNASKSSASSMGFIFQQFINVAQDAEAGKISGDVMSSQMRMLLNMYGAEFNRLKSGVNNELSQMNERQSRDQSIQFMYRVAQMLGGSYRIAPNNPSATIYTINGRTITCFASGPFVNCN